MRLKIVDLITRPGSRRKTQPRVVCGRGERDEMGEILGFLRGFSGSP